MPAKERHKKILSLLNRTGKIRISDLQEMFSVTTETLRRDLNALEKQNTLTKVHGGAILLPRNMEESSFQVRYLENVQEKRNIAKLAAQFIDTNDTIMLDVSTTAFYLAEHIENREDITIITNSLKTLNILSHSKIKTIGLGGNLDTSVYAFVGTQTLSNLDDLYAKHSFISCHSLDMRLGIMDISPEEAAIKEKILSQSETRYLLMDSSKYNTRGVIKINGLQHIDYVITDKQPTQEWLNFFEQFSIKLIYPKQEQKTESSNNAQHEFT